MTPLHREGFEGEVLKGIMGVMEIFFRSALTMALDLYMGIYKDTQHCNILIIIKDLYFNIFLLTTYST